MKFFGKMLKEYRERANLSQGQLAKKLGMLTSNYNPIETGKKRSHLEDETIDKIAAVPELAEIGLTSEKMKAWRMIDLHGVGAIQEAFKEIEQIDPEKFEAVNLTVEQRKQA